MQSPKWGNRWARWRVAGESPRADSELRVLVNLLYRGSALRRRGLQGSGSTEEGAGQGLALGGGISEAHWHHREGVLCPCVSQAGVEICYRVEPGVWDVTASGGRQLLFGNDTCLEKGTGATLPAIGRAQQHSERIWASPSSAYAGDILRPHIRGMYFTSGRLGQKSSMP